MKAHSPSYDLELDRFTDEHLVVLAQECGHHLATKLLILRHRDGATNLIGQLARRHGLNSSDTEDAVQDAVFGILKAIHRYDTRQLGRPKGCTFQSFLRRVLSDRFKDFVKTLWRYRRRYLCVIPDSEALPSQSSQTLRSRPGLLSEAREKFVGLDDPVAEVQWRETMDRFHTLIHQLDETDRVLVNGMLAGNRLRAIASHLNISYDSAKRRRRQLRRRFSDYLGTNSEAPCENAV